MKGWLLLLVFFICNSAVRADDYDILYERLFNDYSAPNPLGPAVIQEYMDSQQANGSWTDITYNDHNFIGGWQPLVHWERLAAMALAFKKAGYALSADPGLKGKIRAGLLYWYNLNPQPYSSNWYDNEIAMPELVYKTLILMKNDFTGADWDAVIEEGCNKYLSLPPAYNTRTLTNAVWIARNLVHHGVIEKDQAILQEGINKMAAQLTLQPAKSQGIQKDGSYLVHRQQLYNAGYGKALISNVSYYMYLTRGLSLVGFSSGNIDMIRNLLLNGDQWMSYGRLYDFSTAGRNLTRKGEQGITSTSLKSSLTRMQSVDPANSSKYQLMYAHLNSTSGSATGITGNKFFPRADYMTHRKPGLFIGVKMCSERTVGTEGLNSENLLGYWLPFGATTIMRNTNEYYDIFGVWDWTKIPGVTNPSKLITWPATSLYLSHPSQFVGGVSDGLNGITAMDLQKDTVISGTLIDISARKANFLWNNEMICLGAGINSSYSLSSTTTTLNQSFLRSAVVIDGVTTPQQESSYTGVRWLHHDNTGYIFRTNTSVQLKTNSQTGNWYTVNKNAGDQAVSADVFKLWLDHGISPLNASYEYVVLPNTTSGEAEVYAENIPVVTHSNTAELQAVTHPLLKQTGAVFYVPGSLVINSSVSVAVDKPCVLLIDLSQPKIKITASDPAQIQTVIQVTLTYPSGNEILNFSMPGGDMAGSSVSLTANNSMYSVGEWSTSTSWVYNPGANTGTGVLNSATGYTTGTTGGTTVSTVGASSGFMPFPQSGSVRLSNISAAPAGTGEWYLLDTLSSPAIKFVSSASGRVAKLAMYDMANATAVASFFYKISFGNKNSTAIDWRFAVGQTNGASNQINNTSSGIPGKTSTTSFPAFFATLRWALASAGTNIPFTYCYRGIVGDGETAGTTYERKIDGLTFSQGGTYNIELYCNNSSAIQTYTRTSYTYSIPANSFHIWANGVQLTANGSPNILGYQLALNSKLDACVFQGSTSTPARSAVCYISDFVVNQKQDVLPVGLNSFSALKRNTSVMLKWQSSSNANIAGFDVLRKTELSDFKLISHVNRTGNSDFSYIDYNPPSGVNYYQLKQVDNSGYQTLSTVIAINSNDQATGLNAFITDAGQLTLSAFSRYPSMSTICIMDMAGRKVLTHKAMLMKGDNRMQIPVYDLAKGIYTVSLINESGMVSTRIIK